jgi:acyl carrier protein
MQQTKVRETKGSYFVSGAVDFEEVVFRAIDHVNELLPDSSAVEKSPDEPLAGVGSKLDSMGIVNLIVAVEEEVVRQCGAQISLADLRGNGASDPLETVGSLVRYLQGALAKP